MVSHAVLKTWPSSLSYDKNLGLRLRFLSTESLGPYFSHGMGDHDQILQHNIDIKSIKPTVFTKTCSEVVQSSGFIVIHGLIFHSNNALWVY